MFECFRAGRSNVAIVAKMAGNREIPLCVFWVLVPDISERGRPRIGWRGQQNREDDERAEWVKLPLRERYDWRALALTAALTAALLSALWLAAAFG